MVGWWRFAGGIVGSRGLSPHRRIGFEAFAEEGNGVVQARAHGPDRHGQNARNLGVGQVMRESQVEDFALEGREAGDDFPGGFQTGVRRG